MKTHWLIEMEDSGTFFWYSKEITIEGQSMAIISYLSLMSSPFCPNGIRQLRVIRLHERSRGDEICDNE